MTKHIVHQVTENYVRDLGYQPGTTLENLVIVRLSRCQVPPFEQQYRIGKYRVDFAWPDRKLILEADGWWHRSPDGAVKDRLRDSWLRSQGWVIFRVDDEHGEWLLDDQVRRIAVIVKLHPDSLKSATTRHRDGCQADVPDYEYDGNKRPCRNRRSANSPYCRIHAKSLSALG